MEPIIAGVLVAAPISFLTKPLDTFFYLIDAADNHRSPMSSFLIERKLFNDLQMSFFSGR